MKKYLGVFLLCAVALAHATTITTAVNSSDMTPIITANSAVTADQTAVSTATAAYNTAFAAWQTSTGNALQAAIVTAQNQQAADQATVTALTYGVCKKYNQNCSQGQNVLSISGNGFTHASRFSSAGPNWQPFQQ